MIPSIFGIIFDAIFSFLKSAFVFVLGIFDAILRFIYSWAQDHKEFSIGFLTCLLLLLIIVVSCTFIGERNDPGPKIISSYEIKAVGAEDGTTIITRGLLGIRKYKIVLSKIKTPSLEQPLGREAKEFLESLITPRMRVDRYSDDVSYSGVVYNSRGECLQKELVKNGYAWSLGQFWLAEEKEARKKRLGIWAIYKLEKISYNDNEIDRRLVEEENP